MSSKVNRDVDTVLTRIEKDRYLITCKCKICNKSYKDLILGSQHVYENHPKREIKNVIENLSWDLQDDLKQWKALQKLKSKRDVIIARLTDDIAINQADIPEIIEIVRRKVSISELIRTLQEELTKKEDKSQKKEEVNVEEEIEEADEEIDERDFETSDEEVGEIAVNTEISETEDEESIDLSDDDEEEESSAKKSKSKSKIEVINDKAEIPKLIELLDREVDKYLRSIKRVSMADDVKRAVEGKKKKRPNLFKLADRLDYYLGISKAIQILKDSS